MSIDILYLIVIVIAIIRGVQRGFIVAIFSVIAIMIGLAAAIKLSAAAAGYLSGPDNASAKWLPVLSFILVFILVVLIVRLGANLIQKTVESASLGWLNRAAGVAAYALLYTIILSVLLFFAEQLHLLSQEATTGSTVYPWIKPVGPYVINGIGRVIPLFKNMFADLQDFFENVSKQLPNK
jgi:membrane protein required for colicin V production